MDEIEKEMKYKLSQKHFRQKLQDFLQLETIIQDHTSKLLQQPAKAVRRVWPLMIICANLNKMKVVKEKIEIIFRKYIPNREIFCHK